MTSMPFDQATVGEIVATDFRAAAVFEQFGIDFCCGGRRTVAEACRSAGADATAVARALEALPGTAGASGASAVPGVAGVAGVDDANAVTRWPLDRLVDRIVETHHAYVRSALPVIMQSLATIVQVHGQRHPELERVAAAFSEMGGDLLQHMMKEERVLFPYIRELAAAGDHRPLQSPFGSIEYPIRMMEREHQEAGDGLRLIRELTNGYEPPADGCTTYRAAMAELARFERDLHRHVHLENNVLFPKAIERERERWRG
jgi:regulator of cell morphogenesis and NO signaling